VEFNTTFSGGSRLRLTVWLYGNSADLVRGQQEIDHFFPLVQAALSDVPSVRIVGWEGGYARLVGVPNREAQLLGMALQVEVND
jgi:hypothetical protein